MTDTIMGDIGGAFHIIPDAVRVDWVNLGEGYTGEYDPDDPEDENLLRFDVYLWNEDTEEWVMGQDASYCTYMPADTPLPILRKAAEEIAVEVDGSSSYKRALERLSWLSPAKFKRNPDTGMIERVSDAEKADV